MKKIWICFLSLTILAGCPLLTRDDVKKQEEEKHLKDQVATIQKHRADSDVKYTDMENDIRVVAGRVESVEFAQKKSEQAYRQEIDQLKRTIEAQNEKFKLIENHIEATESRLTAAIQAINIPASAPSETSSAPKKSESGGGGLYSEGDGFFANKEYKKAIVKFQAFREKNPKGTKAAEATYKIGICFLELGLKKDAKEFFQETIDVFPGTPSAKKAKTRLSQLK